MIKSKFWISYRFWLFFLFISSMYPWFTWKIPYLLICGGGVIINILFCKKHSLYRLKSSDNVFFALLFITCLWLHNFSPFALFGGLLLWGTIFPWVILKEEYKVDVIRFITKYFAQLLLVSFISYVLFHIGCKLPFTIVEYRDSYGDIYNYYSFIYLGRSGPFRFQSVFLEPGHMTMGVAPLLFINRYNLKNKYVLILFIVQLFSFSLAGYLVLIVGYTLQWLSSKKRSMYPLLFIPVFIAGFIYCQTYIFKDDLLARLIVERLTNEDFERTSSALTSALNRSVDSGRIIIGNQYVPEELSGSGGSAGIKVFLYVSGIIGLILISLVYFYPVFVRERATKITASFLIILLALLVQNSYPFWFCIYISLICGSSYLKRKPNHYG